MFVMVEKAPGAFTLRLVSNEEVLSDIRGEAPSGYSSFKEARK
jgi:hypothetical protein